jgi:CPA1 family monovalent cation:H+ antiporter
MSLSGELESVEGKFQIFLILLAVLAGAALLARRINVAPAILLLLSGIALAFVPGMPSLELPPELVLLLVLPPLIYSASVAMSWREFRHNLRLITLLSVGCVIFTACAVAAATHYLIGLPWNVGFLLGAIVAPPDVVAPLAIARKLGLPRRVLVVLEGEGLANDATALILYRFAVVAISTGAFSLPKATGTFFAIVVSEMLFGVAVGWLSLRARHRARDPQVEITLSLITPYVAYWIPEHFGGSGVIATVACGLYISWNGPLLISSATRLQGIFFWDLVIYLIEGLLFLLTGFQMRLLYEKSKAFPLDEILSATVLVAVIIIVARFAWVYPATYLPRFFNKRLRARDPYPPWQNPFIIAFTGVRGAVSLAAALALPFALPGGEGFPYRDLILFVSFGVILITLVGLGSTLPLVVRWLGVANAGRNEHVAEHEREIAARRDALAEALKSLDAMTDDRELSDEVVKLLRARHEIRANQLPDSLDPDQHDVSATGTALTRELIASERKFIHALLRDGKITDETRRRIERDLDLEEASLSNREYRKIPL